MGGLLQNARRFLQGLTPASPARAQRFSVACPEGHRLTGLRNEGYQSLRCPTCGEGIFVLPRSLLPEPVAPSPAVARHSSNPNERAPDDDAPIALTDPEPISSEDADDLAEVQWVDEVPPENPAAPAEDPDAEGPTRPARPKSRRPAGDRKADTAPRPPSRPRGPAARPAASPADTRPRVSLSEWVQRRRNPLVVVAVMLAIAATVAIRSRRSYRQELPRIAERGRVEGLPALDEGKFDRAFQLLSEAKRAVNELGDAYVGAEAIKQGADEAAIINQLVLERPETLLEEAIRTDPKDWPRRFDSVYKGRTVLIDAYVKAAPNTLGEGHYVLDYPVVPDGGDGGPPRSVGQFDLTGFRLFDLIKPRVGDRVTFGARLASLRFDAATEHWLFGLERDSGVIMTHMKALEALGWPPASDLATENAP